MSGKNLSAVDLNLLVAFDALLAERNVTRAAERIGLTQPAVSKALGRLRALFDDELFIRRGRGMEPTAKARALGDSVRRALDEIRGSLGSPAGFDPAYARAGASIGSVDFFDALILPPLLARLGREAPGIALRTVATDRAQGPLLLAEGAFDIGILPMGDMVHDLYAEPLFAERALTLMRKNHPLARPGKLTLEAFAQAGHAKVGIEGRGVAWVDSMLAARGLQRRVMLTVPSFLSLPFVLGATDLISTMPGRLGRLLADSAGIVAVETPLEAPRMVIHLVWHARTHRDPMQVWLRQAIKSVGDGV